MLKRFLKSNEMVGNGGRLFENEKIEKSCAVLFPYAKQILGKLKKKIILNKKTTKRNGFDKNKDLVYNKNAKALRARFERGN